MLTRREMLAVMGCSAAIGPLSAQGVAFGRIDAHAHIHWSIPALIANMEKDNWRALSICVWEQFDNQPVDSDVGRFKTIDELLAATAKVHRDSKGRIAWAGTIDARSFENRDFSEKTIATVQQCFKDGAIGIKIWKTIGMKIRGRSGEYLLPDNKALLPVYEAIQKADRTLIAHLAEPIGAWLPMDALDNVYAAYYKRNPQWHMGNQPGAPAKETILQARDRVLAKFPKLRVVGAHLGSNEEDLGALAKRLDTYPNFGVDCCARIRHFFDGDRAANRQFLDRYQDRILYGSDWVRSKATDEAVAVAVLAQENREWNLLARGGMQNLQNRQVEGLALPESMLHKMFHDNARRWIPGIAPA